MLQLVVDNDAAEVSVNEEVTAILRGVDLSYSPTAAAIAAGLATTIFSPANDYGLDDVAFG
jgi:hypothetical protein